MRPYTPPKLTLLANLATESTLKLQAQKLKYTPGLQKMFLKSAFNQRF